MRAAPAPVTPDTRAGGLSDAGVAERVARGAINGRAAGTSRGWRSILRANVLTRFNALLGAMCVLVLVVGPLEDALFGLILVINTTIGVIQEVRAKRTLDRLALLHAPRARVIRSGVPREVPTAEIVLDDLLELRRGDELPVDAVLVEGSGIEVDESLVSGESEPVDKAVGDSLYSGSFVVAGEGVAVATAVGERSLARSLVDEARRLRPASSELQRAINGILRIVTWVIAPLTALLFWSQLSGTATTADALRASVAGTANLVPEGLVLLTSLAYALGALRLTRSNVLIQELPAVENLARVDVLCFDKTGTLTTGRLRVERLEPLVEHVPLGDVLATLAATEAEPTPSLQAIARDCGGSRLAGRAAVPFSSARRWSGVEVPGLGSYVLGAPETLLAARPDARLAGRVEELARHGVRVLLVCRSPEALTPARLPAGLEPVGIVGLAEELRPDAADTVAFLVAQGVELKVVSGDHPATIAAVARAAGVPERGEPVSGEALPASGSALERLVEDRSVFGRIGPRQKRELVEALQRRGHVVAMTGDGVNDVLALRRADLGIVMGSGSPASRAAGRVVLLDSAFAALPEVLAEGRRVLANVERVAKLFVAKTVYVALLALAIGAAHLAYPLFPRHFTLVSTLTVGVPSFFLALGPATTRLRSGFAERVADFVVPAGVLAFAGAFGSYLYARTAPGSTPAAVRTATTLAIGVAGLAVLASAARPLTRWRIALVATMALGLVGALGLGASRRFFEFSGPSPGTLAAVLAISLPLGALVLLATSRSNGRVGAAVAAVVPRRREDARRPAGSQQ